MSRNTDGEIPIYKAPRFVWRTVAPISHLLRLRCCFLDTMPKERRNRSISIDRHSPCRPSYSAMAERSSSSSFKEWDQVRCPVCMEQPHNTVLLICSSHDKGCRPFMCDTSYRHSNCLDLYRKAFDASALETGSGSPANLTCPLCRGVVSDLKVVQTARKYLNTKVRNCSTETCGFSGAYGELRKHARTEHPFVRPSEVDSERQQDWRRMELQRELGDFFSSIESAIDGWDESLGFFAESRELMTLFSLPTITFFLILSFQGSSRRQGGRARVLSEENFSGSEAYGRFQRNDEGAGDDESYDDDAGHEEALDEDGSV